MKAKYGGVKEEIETMVLLRGIYPRPTTFSIAPEKNLKLQISRNWISMIFEFSIEKRYPKGVYQIETYFSEENWLIFVEFKGKDAWKAAVFPATAQVNTGNQPPVYRVQRAMAIRAMRCKSGNRM